jgi:hypothetical protein
MTLMGGKTMLPDGQKLTKFEIFCQNLFIFNLNTSPFLKKSTFLLVFAAQIKAPRGFSQHFVCQNVPQNCLVRSVPPVLKS